MMFWKYGTISLLRGVSVPGSNRKRGSSYVYYEPVTPWEEEGTIGNGDWQGRKVGMSFASSAEDNFTTFTIWPSAQLLLAVPDRNSLSARSFPCSFSTTDLFFLFQFAIKHADQEQLGKERVYLAYFQVIILHWGKWGKKTKAETMGANSPTFLGMVPPTVARTSHVNHHSRQSDRDSSLVKVPSSRWIKWTL